MSESENNIMMLPVPDGVDRVESGVVQFGDDWPGVFLRGDNAIGIAIILEGVADALPGLDAITEAQLRGTAQSLMACKQ